MARIFAREGAVDAHVVDAVEGGEGSGDGVVGEEEEGADDGEDFGELASGGVDPPTVGIGAADDGVGPADGGDEESDAEDVPEAGEESVVEGEAEDVEA